MLVASQAVAGTIGGGRLEFDAIAAAREMLAGADAAPDVRRYALGPSLGQCCGGVVHLRFERVTALDAPALERRLRCRCARGPVRRRPRRQGHGACWPPLPFA
jgi:xanthine dehydrogenase accessory factor